MFLKQFVFARMKKFSLILSLSHREREKEKERELNTKVISNKNNYIPAKTCYKGCLKLFHILKKFT